MPRAAAEPTATVSACVSPDEQRLCRSAADVAGLSVSAWGARAISRALNTAASRAAVRKAAEQISATIAPRGTRSARVSAVLRVRDHEALKDAEKKAGISHHAFVQAAFLSIAASEMAGVPPVERAAVEAKVSRERAVDGVTVHLPPDFAHETEEAELLAWMVKLIPATSAMILAGQGPKVAAMVRRHVENAHKANLVGVRLALDPFEVAAPAHVLDVPAKAYGDALALQAAKAIRRAKDLGAS